MTSLTTSKKPKETDGTDESFASLFESTITDVREGDVVAATVIQVRDNEVIVDVGCKSEGILTASEFSDVKDLTVGQKIDVLVESREDRNGMVVVSKRKADKILFWDKLMTDTTEGSVVEGRIYRKVRGGFMVDIGMEAFLPASLVALKQIKNLDQFLGQSSKFKIVKINHKRKNVVVSRKDFLEGENEAKRATLLGSLKEGQSVKGRVKNITDFGVFIDLGGLDGLLHITDMSWGRINHPSELVKLGDEVDVQIIGFDRENERVSLGLKQLQDNPWHSIGDRFKPDDRVGGKVVNILPYGVFVELEKGIEGLVHISELSWTKRIGHPSEVLNLGDIVEAIVLGVDSEAKKISLGIKQIESNPWQEFEKSHPADSEIKGQVKGFADYGVFVELEDGVGGLIHVSDISWLKKVPQPSDFFQKGETVRAKILNIDAANKKIALGVKQLTEDPWDQLIQDLKPGSTVRGTISKVVGFGVFIEVSSGLEGLLHISEIPESKAQGLESHFKIGESVDVHLLQIDSENRKISFSLKQQSPSDIESSS